MVASVTLRDAEHGGKRQSRAASDQRSSAGAERSKDNFIILLSLTQRKKLGDYDSYQLSSGHDVTYMIAYLIKRQISKEQTDKEEIEKLLRSSYTHASFEQTELFGRLAEWCVENDMMILK